MVWLAAAVMAGALPACSYLPKAENKVSANTGEVKSTATIKTSTPARHLEPGRY